MVQSSWPRTIYVHSLHTAGALDFRYTSLKTPTEIRKMISNNSINELADKLSSVLPESVKILKTDINDNMKAILESSLRKMNLVSREEFDVQNALLERTIKQLEELEKKLDKLS